MMELHSVILGAVAAEDMMETPLNMVLQSRFAPPCAISGRHIPFTAEIQLDNYTVYTVYENIKY